MVTSRIWPILLIVALAGACATGQKTVQKPRPEKIELVAGQEDSVGYELIIIDPGFESWFQRHRKPEWYYSKDYLATINYQYVVAWNQRVRTPEFNRDPLHPFILEIDYRPGIDYGLDLNYKLYHYFKFIESTWGPILSYDRHFD